MADQVTDAMAGSFSGASDHRRPYIRSHTALRGIAALLVVAYHLQFGDRPKLPVETATHLFDRGYLLVDLFFILSGFVIRLTNDALLSARLNRAAILRFYVARLARVYPLHLFCLAYILAYRVASTALLRLAHGDPLATGLSGRTLRSLVAELFLVQAWVPGLDLINIPAWSISAEAAAYLVFPLIALGLFRRSRLVSALMLGLAALFYFYVGFTSGDLDIVSGLAPARCLSGFVIGVCLCEYRAALSRRFTRWLAWLQVGAVAGVGLCLAAELNDVAVIPFFSLLVASTWQDRGPLCSLLNRKAPLRLGDLSYSVYLNHVWVISVLFPFWVRFGTITTMAAETVRTIEILSCLLLVLALSIWTNRNVEKPGRKYLKRRLANVGRSDNA